MSHFIKILNKNNYLHAISQRAITQRIVSVRRARGQQENNDKPPRHTIRCAASRNDTQACVMRTPHHSRTQHRCARNARYANMPAAGGMARGQRTTGLQQHGISDLG
ncbi:MAG: hypothetical protein ACO3IW_12990 [Burkholderiales bacterium]